MYHVSPLYVVQLTTNFRYQLMIQDSHTSSSATGSNGRCGRVSSSEGKAKILRRHAQNRRRQRLLYCCEYGCTQTFTRQDNREYHYATFHPDVRHLRGQEATNAPPFTPSMQAERGEMRPPPVRKDPKYLNTKPTGLEKQCFLKLL